MQSKAYEPPFYHEKESRPNPSSRHVAQQPLTDPNFKQPQQRTFFSSSLASGSLAKWSLTGCSIWLMAPARAGFRSAAAAGGRQQAGNQNMGQGNRDCGKS